MKFCTLCNITQPLENFHKGAGYKDGRRTWCKSCMSAYKKQYREQNREVLLEKQRVYDAVKNLERREYFAQRYLAQKDRIDALNRQYRELNPHKHSAKETRRRAAKIQRTPVWLDADGFWMIEQAYELAAIRTKMLGVAFEVDHIVPLQGKNASGLHVPENIQVIPAIENRKKYNRFEVSL